MSPVCCVHVRSVLFCMTNRPCAGYKRFKGREEEKEAVKRPCLFMQLYTLLHELTKQIGSEKLVAAVGNKRTSSGAPGCSLLVRLPHPDFV